MIGVPAEHSVASLLARVRRLEAALAPFARIAPRYAARPPQMRLLSTFGADVKVCDLLTAASALADEQHAG